MSQEELPKPVLASCATHHPVELIQIYKKMSKAYASVPMDTCRQSPSPSPSRASSSDTKPATNPFLKFRILDDASDAEEHNKHDVADRVTELKPGPSPPSADRLCSFCV